MPHSRIRLNWTVPSLAVAAMLAFGAHTAFASPASGCGSESGMIGLTCPIGAYGDAYCASQCQRDFGPDSTGECADTGLGEGLGCCRCLI